MLAYLQKPLLAAFALLELCGAAPTPHHTWLPLSEWGHSEPALSSWDYLGLGNAYPLQPRVDAPEPWLPQPAASPTFEIVRAYRKPAVDPTAWAQIPVIGGGRDSSRLWVALVPRGFEDFVLVRKPFVIVEETDEPSKDKKDDENGSKDEKKDDKNASKDEKKRPKDDKKAKEDEGTDDRADESTRAAEPMSSTSSTTARSTSPSTTTSTTPSSPPADDAENAAAIDGDSRPQQTRNKPQK